MIYFIQPKSGGPIKIGTSVQLSIRLKQLAAECGEELEVLAVVEGSFPEESALHRQFAHLQKHGEWFEPGSDLLAFIISDAGPWDGTDESGSCAIRARIPADLAAILKEHVDGIRPKTDASAVIELAIERYFERLGLWPPPADAD